MLRLPTDLVARLRPSFDGRAVCVTGGAGFIGGHIVDALLTLGAAVRVIDDLSNSTSSHLAGLMDLEPRRLTFFHASVLDDDAIAQAIANTQSVIHLAAIGSVPKSVVDPARFFAVNATGTLRVLEAARHAGCERVVLAASSSAYGDTPTLPKREDMPASPTSPYGASKAAAEQLCAVWSKTYGLDTACLRYFNVFGPRQPAGSVYAAVIPAFATKLLAGESPVVFGDGSQTRDFTHVTNVVAATLLAAASDEALNGEVINIAAGEQTSLLDLVDAMGRAHGKPDAKPAFEPVFEPARPGEIVHSWADITKAERLLGYTPIVGFRDGLEQTLEWFAEASDAAGAR